MHARKRRRAEQDQWASTAASRAASAAAASSTAAKQQLTRRLVGTFPPAAVARYQRGPLAGPQFNAGSTGEVQQCESPAASRTVSAAVATVAAAKQQQTGFLVRRCPPATAAGRQVEPPAGSQLRPSIPGVALLRGMAHRLQNEHPGIGDNLLGQLGVESGLGRPATSCRARASDRRPVTHNGSRPCRTCSPSFRTRGRA